MQAALQSTARRDLAAALSDLPGPKALLVDDTLYDSSLSVVRPLELFTDSTFMREHGLRKVASLAAHTARPIPDVLSQPALVILIRGVNAAAARHAVSVIRRLQASVNVEHDTGNVALPLKDNKVSSSDQKTEPSKSTPGSVSAKCLVLTTPRPSAIVEKVLRRANLRDIRISTLPLGFLPFDADLVTLDWPEAYRQIVLDGDNSAIHATASALSTLATTFKLDYTTIRSAGAAATAVAEELLETHGAVYLTNAPDRSGSSAPSSTQSSPLLSGRSAPAPFGAARDAFTMLDGGTAVDTNGNGDEMGSSGETMTLAEVVGTAFKRRPVTLVLIDRGVDMVTPLLTQWTYEGLLDEAIGLRNNVMDLPVALIKSDDAMSYLTSGTNASGAGGTMRKTLRGDVDRIFAQLRDLNYWEAAREIGNVAESVKEVYARRPGRDTTEISEIRNFVNELRDIQSEHLSAAAHTAIAAEISARTFDSHEFKQRFGLERDMIEGSSARARRIYICDALARGVCLSHVLRLACLWSVTSSGIAADELDLMKKELIAKFGLGVLPLLANLERAGMLVQSHRDTAGGNLSWIPLPNFGGSGGSGNGGVANSTIGVTPAASTTGVDNSDVLSTTGSISSTAIGSDESSARGYRVRARGAADYSWQFARAALRLVTEFDPERAVKAGTTEAVASPYSGYTPLSVRLAEAGMGAEGWGGLPQIATHTALLPPGHATVEHRRWDGNEDGAVGVSGEVDVVIVMVGGMVRAEASAFRLAARAKGVRALLATTGVVGADEFVLSLNDGHMSKL